MAGSAAGRLRNIARGVTPVALGMALSGCALLPAGRSAEIAANEPTPTPIPTSVIPIKPTYTVKVGEIMRERTFSGRVAPVVEEALFFRVSGRVRSVYVKRNDFVTAGQVIADLEIDDLERELTSTQLNLERAQARLNAAERNLEFQIRRAQINLDIAMLQLMNLRTERPDDNFAISVQSKQVELAEIALEQLSEGVDPLLVNDVKRAQLLVEKLESAIADGTITAPFDGQLLSVSLTAGRPVNAFDTVVSIADITDLEVKADLISDQMNDLEEGMVVEVSLVGRPGAILKGFVRRLPYPFGSGGSGAVTEVDKSTRLTIDESAQDAGYELGDLVQVRVQLEHKESVLWLPTQAIRVFDGRRFVVVQDGDVQRRVDVKLGIQTPDRVEVEEGLEEGQIVVGQ
ncbi:MAG: efflux RND transporter periplasmic adaptor subunit [Caldilineaceae bacterium]|nr:efflux RND transporter periplasmic adaptor subunit [Caldilineaceae bacterium]